MMFMLLIIILLIDNSQSLEWNCMENKSNNEILPEQCTITVEYISLEQKKQICLTHTLSINTLPPPSYSFNYTMKIFQINYCQLLTINQLPFTLPSSVEILDLKYNLLSTFTLSFPLPSYLKYLYLDYNPNLKYINFGHKRVQDKLISLSLRYNKYIQFSSLPFDLKEIDLTNCNLLQSSVLILLKSLTKLTHLSLGENQLEQLPILDESMQLEYLNLSSNYLTFIDNKWLYKQMKILDLSFNQIKSLEFFKEILKINQTLKQNNNQSMDNHVLQLSLRGNPLICDCWLGGILNSPSINITDLSLVQCNSRPTMNISPDDLLCSYSRHCTSDCTCCDFEACDCHSICPSECLCSHDIFWSEHIIQCENKNLSNIHLLLPEIITELNYEKNNIEELKPFIFIGKIFLKKLNLAKNNLRILTNETFCGAINLHEINLSYNPNLMSILPNINELFACLKSLESIILSKEQIHEDEQISHGWTIDSNKQFIRLIRITQPISSTISSSTSSSNTIPISTSIYPSFQDENEPSTILSIYHQESYTTSSIIQENQTLIIIVFFLLFFVLLFLLLLISLAICRRKVRHHLTTELERQRSDHYYCHHHHHSNLHQSSIKIPDSNTTSAGANDSIYEQLPSLSSDSEQPFLYNDKKLNNTNAPALPPYPPTFHHYHCYRPHEYQYNINTDYSQQQQQQCPAVLVLAKPLLYHECSSEKQQDNNTIRFCNNETVIVPTTLCRCKGHMPNSDTYMYPNVHR